MYFIQFSSTPVQFPAFLHWCHLVLRRLLADHFAQINGRLFVRESQMSALNLKNANLLTVATQ